MKWSAYAAGTNNPQNNETVFIVFPGRLNHSENVRTNQTTPKQTKKEKRNSTSAWILCGVAAFLLIIILLISVYYHRLKLR